MISEIIIPFNHYFKQITGFCIAVFFFMPLYGQQLSDTILIDTGKTYTALTDTPSINIRKETAENRCIKKFPPYYHQTEGKYILRNQEARFGKKVLRGSGLVVAFQSSTFGLLYIMPEGVSNWDKSAIKNIRQNIKDAYTKSPVIDKDKWYVNYIGHPVQGAYYYNAARSQGLKSWQAGLFCLGHSMLWEYTIEAGLERPSIQDMIVTPIAGSLLGELFHFATMRMCRNGFKWYEKAFVSVFNPMFAINNGFRFANPK
jgi:hypothetical protein